MAPAAPHIPVLRTAVAALAEVRPGALWCDGTLGFGGHSEALLEGGARVLGIDQDPEALRSACDRLEGRFADRFTPARGNFRDIRQVLDARGIASVDGILVDLGVSSWQLDRPERGFSFDRAGPVDMRMNPDGPETALELLRRLDTGELTSILRRYGEEPFAPRIARAVRAWALGDGPHDTAGLAGVVADAMPAKARAKLKKHPATRTFQAIRIAVNDELGALEALLAAAPACLADDGRLLVISFHSLEDRLVKRTFADWSGKHRGAGPRPGLPPPIEDTTPAPFELLTRKPARADAEEIVENPRARSAMLRAVRKRRTGEAA